MPRFCSVWSFHTVCRWSGHRVPRLRPTRAREKLNYKLSAQALGGAAQLATIGRLRPSDTRADGKGETEMKFYLIHCRYKDSPNLEQYQAIDAAILRTTNTNVPLWDRCTWIVESDQDAVQIGQAIRQNLPSESDRLIVAEISGGNTVSSVPLDPFGEYFLKGIPLPNEKLS